MAAVPDLDDVVAALRAAGARYAYLHGSRAAGTARPDSDTDVAASFAVLSGRQPPQPWDLDVPDGVDLLVLERAPLYLAGRVALHGRLLFDDDPPARVAWEADTRVRWLDERPLHEQMAREYLRVPAGRGPWSTLSASGGCSPGCATTYASSTPSRPG